MKEQGRETYQSVDELQVTSALRIAVTSSVFGTSRVGFEAFRSTISVHGDEVKSTVETAWKVGEVNIEGELIVEEVEELVGAVILHHVDAGADILGLSISDESEGERFAVSGDTVGGFVVSTLEGTVLSASLVVRAELGVPLITIVAVGDVLESVDPAPVGVNHNLTLDSLAAAAGAVLPRHGRVSFLLLSTSLLAIGRGDEERSESKSTEHVDCFSWFWG